MPSGHTALAFGFAVAAGSEYPPVRLPLALAAAGVAWSRLDSARHFPSDVVVGAAVGAAAGGCVHASFNRWLPQVK